MKHIFLCIISILFSFSTLNVYARDTGLIEDVLNLNFWPIIYDLTLDEIDNYQFKNSHIKASYNHMKRYDQLVRKEIVKQYMNGNYSTTTINGIVKNYKLFVYHTNELFYFFSQIERYPSLKNEVDIQDGILKSYRLAQSYYQRVKALTFQTEKK